MKAIVRFHYGNIIYDIGDEVPEFIINKYPHLVGLIYEKSNFEVEKKEYDKQPEKAQKESFPKKIKK